MKNAPDHLEIRYLPLSQITTWEDNTKLHDLGSLVSSIERYGFRDAIIFDETLKCIVAGHGRILALAHMKKQGSKVPKGIINKDGDWNVPVQFGINGETPEQAKAFAIDHNNLVASGMEYQDVARMYENGYANVLKQITQVTETVTVTQEQAGELQRFMNPEIMEGSPETDVDVSRSTMTVGIRLLVLPSYLEEAKKALQKAINPAQAIIE